LATIRNVKTPNGTTYSIDIGDPFEYLEAKYPDGGAGLHNSIYRGKNLGTAPTDAQYASIKSGKFTGIWLGDYWSNGNRIYRNGGANYFGQSGDNSTPPNHILVIPDSGVLSADGQTTKYMQDTNTIPETGYIGTKMWTDTLPNLALPIFSNIFGSHILSHRELLCNGASNGVATSWAWTDVKINIPNQAMVYGHTPWKQGVYGDGYQTGNRKTLLPLFAVRPDLVHTRSGAYWLSDFASSTDFAHVSGGGDAGRTDASSPLRGVRPYVIID